MQLFKEFSQESFYRNGVKKPPAFSQVYGTLHLNSFRTFPKGSTLSYEEGLVRIIHQTPLYMYLRLLSMEGFERR